MAQELQCLLDDPSALEALCLTLQAAHKGPGAPPMASAPAPALASGCSSQAPGSACTGKGSSAPEAPAEWAAVGGGRRARRKARAHLRASGRQRDSSPAAAACRAMLESYLLQVRLLQLQASFETDRKLEFVSCVTGQIACLG